ncbi:hypothetical protein LAZ67_20001421 [Cordylochernes scorpioides]|uniref:Transposase n=1 Tax=Cordylochernes scorpioides TaxID=51811 RepID=A0ABY6LJY9_9ARAC|nr:hypothetical protein LAZ67_20001421 [Cordylochernes scorpioides]
MTPVPPPQTSVNVAGHRPPRSHPPPCRIRTPHPKVIPATQDGANSPKKTISQYRTSLQFRGPRKQSRFPSQPTQAKTFQRRPVELREQLFLNGILDLKLAEFPLKMNLGKDAQNVQKITDLIKENPRTTLLELEQDTDISKITIGRIVTKDLKLKKTPAKFIPRFLTNEQKLCRLATCENMLEMTRTDPEWKDKIITGDETWVYDYDPETKRQYAEWRGQDIAPNDFFLFPKLKAVLKGRHFDTRDDIIEKSLLALKSIPKELYKNCFDNLGKRWRRWFSRFKNRMESVKDEKRVGVQFCTGTLKRRIALKLPKKMLEMVEENPNWKEEVITGDETWIYRYEPEIKRQSMEWKGKDEPKTKKSQLCKSKNKVLLVTFFDKKEIVHYEYLEEGQTTNKESYLNIMRRVRESIRLKRNEMWSSKNWIIHHDNAPPHTDLALNDFFLFPKLKMALKGRRFDTRESIIADSKKVLKKIPKDAFSKCFKSWEKR